TGAGGGTPVDPGRGTARVLQGRRREAVTRAVPRDLGGGAETVGPSPNQMARAAALVRVDPDDGRGAASDRAVLLGHSSIRMTERYAVTVQFETCDPFESRGLRAKACSSPRSHPVASDAEPR